MTPSSQEVESLDFPGWFRLRVHAELDTSTYPTGLTIPDSTMKALSESGTLTRHEWHPDWNYTLKKPTN